MSSRVINTLVVRTRMYRLFKNHTDAELKILEAIVGREVPFGLESELYKGERRDY